MDLRFYLINERTGQQFEIEEPVGTDGFKPVLKRDPKTHGLAFEFAEQELSFEGREREMIIDEYEQYGVDADITFLIEINCNGEWSEFYSGKLLFIVYETVSGYDCFARLNVGQTGVQIVFTKRAETKVDLESLQTLDGSVMPPYRNLGKSMEIPSKTILLASKSTMIEQDALSGGANIYSDYKSGSKYNVPFGNSEYSGVNEFDPSPKFRIIQNNWDNPLFVNTPDSGITQQYFDISGKILYGIGGGGYAGGTFRTTIFVFDTSNNIKYSKVDEIYIPWTGEITHFNIDIDLHDLEIQKYWKFNIVYTVIVDEGLAPKDIRVYPESYISISTYSKSKPTDSKIFMLHEALSRITESITDNRLTVRSDYFGRIDSEVNNPGKDGAAGLRCLTTGLLLRNAEPKDGYDPKFTASFKDLLDGLIATDAVGIGIEGGRLRVEPWEYFYQDTIILVCDDIAEITRKVDPAMCFALAGIGYAKWEAEEWNGIDGFHGKRQYRTKLKNVDTRLEQYSKLVADAYAIESTRRRGIYEPSKDWRYDNDIFIFDLKREEGIISVNTGSGDPNTLIDPETVFNVELSPARNAARWFSYIMQGVKPSRGDQLIYTGTEGYAGARTSSNKVQPIMTGTNIPESGNISRDAISGSIVGISNTPFLRPETVEFEYPLTFAEFAKIKANPYGMIVFNGEAGWIRSIEADLFRGIAKFVLIPEYTEHKGK